MRGNTNAGGVTEVKKLRLLAAPGLHFSIPLGLVWLFSFHGPIFWVLNGESAPSGPSVLCSGLDLIEFLPLLEEAHPAS